MGRRVQLVRHATGAADAFVGLQGEVTVDTTAKELRVHDGLSAGGVAHARADLANVNGATTSLDGKLVAADKQKLDWIGITQDVDLDNLESEVALALADIIAIEAKTDFIVVTQAVNLDAMESNIATLDADLNIAEAKLATIESGATADQTDAEIRAAVEAASNSNVFTDADHTKLNSVESGATADQTGGEIKTVYESEANTNAFTDAEQTKLAGIEADAEVNNTFRGALVKQTSNQILTTGVKTNITFNAEEYDTDSIHDISANNERLTVPSSVTRVRVVGSVKFTGNGTGVRELEIQKNGAANFRGASTVKQQNPHASFTETLFFSSAVIAVVATDYFTLNAFQNSGGNLDAQTIDTWFALEIIE